MHAVNERGTRYFEATMFVKGSVGKEEEEVTLAVFRLAKNDLIINKSCLEMWRMLSSI